MARKIIRGSDDHRERAADSDLVPFSAVMHAPVSALMQRDPATVRPDTSVEMLTELLIERGRTAAPVVDDSGRPIGVVGLADVARARFEDGETSERRPVRVKARGNDGRGIEYPLGGGFHVDPLARGTVAEIMVPVPTAVAEWVPIARVCALLACEGLPGLPVVNAQDRVIGMVESVDLLRWLAEHDGYVVASNGHPRLLPEEIS
jgi:CBS domain-containing protein